MPSAAFGLLNGRDLDLPVDVAEAIVVAVATGEVDVAELAATLDRQIVTEPRSDAP